MNVVRNVKRNILKGVLIVNKLNRRNKFTHKGRKKMPFLTEPTEAECFEAEQELLFDVRFRQMDREIRKMIEADKLKGVKNTKTPNNEDDMQNQHWCMCVKLKDVARDYKSTCSICGGRDAYGLSTERPEDKKKTITTA